MLKQNSQIVIQQKTIKLKRPKRQNSQAKLATEGGGDLLPANTIKGGRGRGMSENSGGTAGGRGPSAGSPPAHQAQSKVPKTTKADEEVGQQEKDHRHQHNNNGGGGAGQQPRQQSQHSDSTTSSSSASSSVSAMCRAEHQQHQSSVGHQQLLLNSSASSVCPTPSELLLQQSLFQLQHHQIQQQLAAAAAAALPPPPSAAPAAGGAGPLSFQSLHYGPFGLPSFALSPQGHSLVHFPQQQQLTAAASCLVDKSQQQQQTAATLFGALASPSPTVQQQQQALNASLVATQNAYEGLPIFIVPHPGALSLNALQRAAEFKAMAISSMLQQQSAGTAVTGAQPPKQQFLSETSKHFHVFVGDLSQEVDNQLLMEAFQKYGEVSEAKVMRDPQSTKSRSFGFVAFPNKEDAQRAIEGMNGTVLGRRTIRTGWAVRRASTAGGGQSGSEDERATNPSATFEFIYNATEADNTTIYLGGLSNTATEEPIRTAFGQFGVVKEIRLFAAQNFGFVVFSDKMAAARAIMEMHGKELDLGIVGGKCKLRVKWGKPIQQPAANGGGPMAAIGIGTTNHVCGATGTAITCGIGTSASANMPTGTPVQALVSLSQSSARLAHHHQQQQQHQLALAAVLAAANQHQQQQPHFSMPIVPPQPHPLAAVAGAGTMSFCCPSGTAHGGGGWLPQ